MYHSENQQEKYVAYYRRSKKVQDSTLGLEAQTHAVERYINSQNGVLIGEFTELESGTAKNRHKRVQIIKAIGLAKELNATLVIAKLDRLARDVEFTAMLCNTGVRFIACDMPSANEMTIKLVAVINEDEAKRIGKRTKDALDQLKQKGVPLGCNAHKNPGCKITREAIFKSIEKRKQLKEINTNNRVGRAMAQALKLQGQSLVDIAKNMNDSGYRSSTGKPIMPMTVKRWLI